MLLCTLTMPSTTLINQSLAEVVEVILYSRPGFRGLKIVLRFYENNELGGAPCMTVFEFSSGLPLNSAYHWRHAMHDNIVQLR